MNKQVFVCVWLPCSGKGTQSRAISNDIKAHRIEAWAQLNEIIKGNIAPELSQAAKDFRTMPGSLSSKMIDKIEAAKLWSDFWEDWQALVLDGFWRRRNSYNILCEVFGRDTLTFIWFMISKETMLARAAQRWIDPDTRESYSGFTEAEAQFRWLEKRESDKPEVLRRRLKAFNANTLRVLERHRSDWWRVIWIDANSQSQASITQNVLRRIQRVVPELGELSASV